MLAPAPPPGRGSRVVTWMTPPAALPYSCAMGPRSTSTCAALASCAVAAWPWPSGMVAGMPSTSNRTPRTPKVEREPKPRTEICRSWAKFPRSSTTTPAWPASSSDRLTSGEGVAKASTATLVKLAAASKRRCAAAWPCTSTVGSVGKAAEPGVPAVRVSLLALWASLFLLLSWMLSLFTLSAGRLPWAYAIPVPSVHSKAAQPAGCRTGQGRRVKEKKVCSPDTVFVRLIFFAVMAYCGCEAQSEECNGPPAAVLTKGCKTSVSAGFAFNAWADLWPTKAVQPVVSVPERADLVQPCLRVPCCCGPGCGRAPVQSRRRRCAGPSCRPGWSCSRPRPHVPPKSGP